MTTKVLLADGYVFFRDAVRSLIEMGGDCVVVAETSDGQSALSLIAETGPDLVITETVLSRLSGIEVARRCRRDGSRGRFIFLSARDGSRLVKEAFGAGAAGYVSKEDPASELLRAIDAVRSDRPYVSPSIAAQLANVVSGRVPSPAPGDSALSSRESEVLQLIVEGMSSKEIAAALGLSTRTVDSHRSNLMDKLDIHKVAGLVRYAIREGLVNL